MYSKLVLLAGLLPRALTVDYISHGGFSPSEQTHANATTLTPRHSGQMRQILLTLVCGNDPTCPYSAGKFYKALHNYGCNCYPDNFVKQSAIENDQWSHMGANGKPLDWIDRACLDVHDAYRCMLDDYNNGLIVQDTEFGCYEGMGFVYHTDASGDIICGPESNPNYANNNKNGCRLAACQIERNFAYALRETLEDPVTFFKDNKKIMYDHYNDDTMCFRTGSVDTLPRDSCCGEYPSRRPFSSVTHDCCLSGDVKLFGEC